MSWEESEREMRKYGRTWTKDPKWLKSVLGAQFVPHRDAGNRRTGDSADGSAEVATPREAAPADPAAATKARRTRKSRSARPAAEPSSPESDPREARP
jgi:hypothetical protein